MQISLLLTIRLFLYTLALWLGSYLLAVPSENTLLEISG